MILVVNLAKNRSPDALQGEPKSPTQTLAVKTINSEQIYQQNCPQRSLRTLTLSSIIIIILPYHHRHHNQQRQLQHKQKHHHQYHLYNYRLNIFTIITIIIIIIIITKPFISSSSSPSTSSSSLLQLFGTKTCWKKSWIYARFGGTPLLFLFHDLQKLSSLKKG